MEGLSALPQKNEAAGNIHGCKVARWAPSVNHLLFADDAYLLFRVTPTEGTMVKNILDIYEAASGQTINYSRSSITFSTNVDAQTKVTVCNIFQIQAEHNHIKYLGLPTLIGRDKKEVFTYDKEILWHRLQGWRTKNVSQAGKEVLLKTVAQALPNYVMNVFLLPHELCLELERMMNSFWWGGSNIGSRGIRWTSWDNLCVPKNFGGLVLGKSEIIFPKLTNVTIPMNSNFSGNTR